MVFKTLLLILSPLFTGMLTAQAVVYSVAEPDVKWNRREIRVCWAPAREEYNRFTEAEKATVKEAVQAEYSAERTGIYFVGFNDCPAKNDGTYDVTLMQKTDQDTVFPGMVGLSCLGQYGMLGEDGYRKKLKHRIPFVYLRAIRKNPVLISQAPRLLKMTAIHEFGHLSGLRHEHIRAEAQKDIYCERYKKELPKNETLHKSTKHFTTYDQYSIMSYCWNWTMLEHPAWAVNLSEGDVATLKSLYPNERKYY